MRSIVLIGPLTILLLLVVACGGDGPDLDLVGEGTWVLETLDGRPIIEESTITLRVGDSWIDGIDGCNSYGGRSEEGAPVAGADGVLSIPPFGATQMLCPEPEGVMDQADAYIAALAQGERFVVADDRLEVLDSGGATRLIFVRRAPLPGSPFDLKGTAWRLIIEGDAMDGARAPTLAFLDHRLVTGATACRSYVATHRASEGALRFPGKGMLGSSRQPCTKNERTLEGEFTDFLTWAREYSIDETGGSGRLTIWSIRGKTLTFEPLPQAVEGVSDTDWSLTAFVELRLDPGAWLHRTTKVVQGTEVTIEFDDHGISGFTGCNVYGGQAMVEEGTITVDQQAVASTAIGCAEPEGLMEQEKRFLSLVQRATRYGIYGDSLFMRTDDDVFLLFQARPPWEASPPPETSTTVARGRGPSPTIFGQGWKADQSLIAPGEPVTVTLELRNVWDKPAVFSDFPTTMTLTDVDKRVEEPVPLKLQIGGGPPDRMEPGEELVVLATVSPSVSAGLQPGRYSLGIRFQIAHTPGIPEHGQTRLGLNSGILFVVIPPEGALEGSVVVGKALEGYGVRITLDSVHFTLEETRIMALAEPLANGSEEPGPALAVTPTPFVSSQSTPTPLVSSQVTPTPTPVGGQITALKRDIADLTAFYRLDGGAWHVLGGHGYRMTADGVDHEWSFGPVSANASTFEFAIIPGVRPGSDGVFDYPTGDGASPWEWTVLLQEVEER